jgi:hypothetical protein
MLKNQKGRSRFIMNPDKDRRILPCVETFEEKKLIPYFLNSWVIIPEIIKISFKD